MPPAFRRGATGGDLRALDSVWVPNRNGLFLAVAASRAEAIGARVVLVGFNRDEAVDFPDNRPEFVERTNRALELSTRGKVQVVSFTQHLDKSEILAAGVELGVPIAELWSCYEAGERLCGRCASCEKLRRALERIPPEHRPSVRFLEEA
jgi:7-cyano-7-deazaguanine synthase